VSKDKKGVGESDFFSKVLKGKGEKGGARFGGRTYKERVDFESFSIVGRKERVKKCEHVEGGRDGCREVYE
jgi:hypothetical protein